VKNEKEQWNTILASRSSGTRNIKNGNLEQGALKQTPLKNLSKLTFIII